MLLGLGLQLPVCAYYFAVYGINQVRFQVNAGLDFSAIVTTACGWILGHAGGRDSPVVQFGGGVMASLVQSTVTVPMEVVRQRQMVQTSGEGSYTVKFLVLVSWFSKKTRVGGILNSKNASHRLHVHYNHFVSFSVFLFLWQHKRTACS